MLDLLSWEEGRPRGEKEYVRVVPLSGRVVDFSCGEEGRVGLFLLLWNITNLQCSTASICHGIVNYVTFQSFPPT